MDQRDNRGRESLSIILPAYNEEGNIARAAEAIGAVMRREGIDAALYFIDDGSTDGTWEAIEKAARESDRVNGVRFSRNFGKEAAIFAGLQMARGECCAVMDCDLQHPPETLPEMYRLWRAGYQVVEGVKADRGKEGAFHRGMAKLFYRLMSAATRIDMSRASDFKLLDREVVDALAALPERNTFFRALSSWVGYKTVEVEYSVREREVGDSKWSTFALFRYAINNITSFTTKPLQLVTILGVVFLILAAVQGVDSLISYLTHRAVAGSTTVILLELIIGSIMMISLGIIGEYIAKIYDEVKGRPRFIVSGTVGAAFRENRHDAV